MSKMWRTHFTLQRCKCNLYWVSFLTFKTSSFINWDIYHISFMQFFWFLISFLQTRMYTLRFVLIFADIYLCQPASTMEITIKNLNWFPSVDVAIPYTTHFTLQASHKSQVGLIGHGNTQNHGIIAGSEAIHNIPPHRIICLAFDPIMSQVIPISQQWKSVWTDIIV